MPGCCCCFPPTAKVLTTSGNVLIKNLTSNDQLVTVNKKGVLTKTPFFTYLHYDNQLCAEFLVLQCDNGKEIQISESHLIYKAVQGLSQVPVPASTLVIGDLLVFVDNNNGSVSYPKITNIYKETVQGVYAPLTDKGTLIVDGFKTSCYAEVESHRVAHRSMAPLRAWIRGTNLIKTKSHNNKNKAYSNEIHGYAKLLSSIRSVLLLTA